MFTVRLRDLCGVFSGAHARECSAREQRQALNQSQAVLLCKTGRQLWIWPESNCLFWPSSSPLS